MKSVLQKYDDQQVYLSALFIKDLAYTMHHAVLSIILLDKGMSFSQIAVIQAMYSLSMLIFEFPSGLLSDLVARKGVYLASNLLLSLVYIFIYFSDSFVWLCLSWFLYGISSALETGTIDSEIVIQIMERSEPDLLAGFLGKRSRISSIAALLGSGIGFILYGYIDKAIYFVMVLVLSLASLIIFFYYEGFGKYSENTSASLAGNLKNLAQDLRSLASLPKLILTAGILQAYVQVHFQLWQSYFISLNISENYFYIIYLIFQLISYLAYRFNVNRLGSGKILTMMLLTVLLSISMYAVDLSGVKLLFYFLLVGLLTLLNFKTEFEIQEVANKERISSTISLVSTILRVFGFIALMAASLLIESLGIDKLFLIVPIFSICLAGLILISLDKEKTE